MLFQDTSRSRRDVSGAGEGLRFPKHDQKRNNGPEKCTDDLTVGPHDNVWLRFILALCVTLFLPSSLHGKATKMNCFGRTSGGRTNGVLTFLNTPEMRNNGNLTSGPRISFAVGERISSLEKCLQTSYSPNVSRA